MNSELDKAWVINGSISQALEFASKSERQPQFLGVPEMHCASKCAQLTLRVLELSCNIWPCGFPRMVSVEQPF